MTTIVSSVGKTTGPPADRLYAVEPVGVESTTPSAAYDAIVSPLAATRTLTTRAKPPLCSTTSLSAIHCCRSTPRASSTRAWSAMRDSAR